MREFDPSRLDVAAFAKDAGELSGDWPVAELERLADSVAADWRLERRPAVHWLARGEQRGVPTGQRQAWLHLHADVVVAMQCQRCLLPVEVALKARRSFLFVHGEASAAELDADSEHDVLALTRDLDLKQLVEDELLLNLPLVPRHATCPTPIEVKAAQIDPPDDAPHPFAGLAAWRKGRSQN